MILDYTLIRAARKSITIYIRNGRVEVRAPVFYQDSDIEEFILEKKKWIMDTLQKSQERLERKNSFSLNYGDMVLYRGSNYPVVAGSGKHAEFDGTAFRIPPDLSPEQIKSACVRLYRALAKSVLTERTYALAEKMGVAPSVVKINNAKARWGSCTSNKTINYAWMLVMADDEVIDYIIAHELSHIYEMNHSKRFWERVGAVFPDYKERKARLHELQERVLGENWDV